MRTADRSAGTSGTRIGLLVCKDGGLVSLETVFLRLIGVNLEWITTESIYLRSSSDLSRIVMGTTLSLDWL